MTASLEDVEGWVSRGEAMGARYIISVCDSFDYSDYPVYVMPIDDLEKIKKHYDNVNMQRINEVIELKEQKKKKVKKKKVKKKKVKKTRKIPRSDTKTLIGALRILVEDIQSEDGVANMAIAEAADRLEELVVDHDRYETVRKMTPKKFGEVCKKNLNGESFDKMIDEIAQGDGMCKTQRRVKKVLENMIALSEEEGTYADWFSMDLEKLLNDYLNEDSFGTEGQHDPRGDQRQGEYSMGHVFGVDD